MIERSVTREIGRGGLAFTGGGTAGHVFPGLAVAEEVMRLWPGEVFWIGTGTGIERALVEQAGLPFHSIPAGKLRRYFSVRNVTDLARIAAGVVSSFLILARLRPALLFSKGGFVSVPPVVAASLLGIPCFTHESDFDPGLATRINMRFCEKVFVSFPETVRHIPPAYRGKAVVSGNPVRSAILKGAAEEGRRIAGCGPEASLLLALGGSQGSAAVNALIAAALPHLPASTWVVHQMGARDHRPSDRPGYVTAPFFGPELPHLFAAADLVVSRSGANILAELAALGKPSILVPLPEGGMSRGDQVRNAELFRSRGASLVLPQEGATGEKLALMIAGLLADPGRIREMGVRARGLGGGEPAAEIARHLVARAGQGAR